MGKTRQKSWWSGAFSESCGAEVCTLQCVGGISVFLRLSIWSNTWPFLLEATISMAKVVHLQWTVPASCTHSWRSWGMSWEGMNPVVLKTWLEHFGWAQGEVLLLLMDSGPGPCCISLATWSVPLNFEGHGDFRSFSPLRLQRIYLSSICHLLRFLIYVSKSKIF